MSTAKFLCLLGSLWPFWIIPFTMLIVVVLNKIVYLVNHTCGQDVDSDTDSAYVSFDDGNVYPPYRESQTARNNVA